MAEAKGSDNAYFSLPESSWADVKPQVRAELRRLFLSIAAVLAEQKGEEGLAPVAPAFLAGAGPSEGALAKPLPPAQLAVRLSEVAAGIMESSAGNEYDLRQIITTLRTALTVCWDFYGAQTAERVTVAEHMRDLKERIQDFEQELVMLREGPP